MHKLTQQLFTVLQGQCAVGPVQFCAAPGLWSGTPKPRHCGEDKVSSMKSDRTEHTEHGQMSYFLWVCTAKPPVDCGGGLGGPLTPETHPKLETLNSYVFSTAVATHRLELLGAVGV